MSEKEIKVIVLKDIGYTCTCWSPITEGILVAETENAFKVKRWIFSTWYSKKDLFKHFRYEIINPATTKDTDHE